MDYHELHARYAAASEELQRRLAASAAAVTAMTRAGEAETAAMRDLYAILPTFTVTGSPRTPHGAVQVVLWKVLDDGDVVVHYLAGERMIALLHKNAEGTAYVQTASFWRTLINEGHPAQITAPADVVERAIRELRALQANARPVELARAARRRADAQCEATQRWLTECKDALAAASQADQAAKLQWYATNQDYARLHPTARVLVTRSDTSGGCAVRVTLANRKRDLERIGSASDQRSDTVLL